MSARSGIGPLFGLAVMMIPVDAMAGAWTLDAGTGLAIVTNTTTSAELAFDSNGRIRSIPRYDKSELQALVEYGVTDWFTVILSPSLQHVGIAAPLDATRSGVGYSELGGRVRLMRGDSWMLSAQTTLRGPGTSDSTNPAAIGYTEPEIDVRGLVGYSFSVSQLPAFVDLQIAQRFRTGGFPDEFRVDATFGIRPAAKWLLLAQSFNVISEGAGGPISPSYDYQKVQLSAVYEVAPSLAVQLGAVTTYRGRNALKENGVVLGTWLKF